MLNKYKIIVFFSMYNDVKLFLIKIEKTEHAFTTEELKKACFLF